jgi:hypothetical protein
MPAFKNSIWKRDSRYAFDYGSASAADLAILRELGDVDRAKKQVAQVGPADLLKIAGLIDSLPRSAKVSQAQFARFLAQMTSLRGVGLPTAVCMLAVRTGGDYAPMDRKVAAGMRAGVPGFRESDVDALCTDDSSNFASIYLRKVMPAWRKSLDGRTPEEADVLWARQLISLRRTRSR